MIFLFDFFGVVVDWSSDDVIPQLAEYAKMPSFEFRAGSIEELELCEAGKLTMLQLWSRLGKKFKVEPAGLERIFRERFLKTARLNKDVVKIVKSLPSALFSNQLPVHFEICSEKGWFDSFSKVFLSFELGLRKPNPRAYNAVIKGLGVKPSSIVFVDDKEENVEGAAELGIHGVLFRNPVQLRRDLGKFIKFGEAKK